MNCIYCDTLLTGQNKTNEHIIPQWMIRHLEIKHHRHNIQPVSKELIKFKPRYPVTHTFTYKICNTCNNGWLSQIDNSCKELLILLMDGNEEKAKEVADQISADNLHTLIYKIFLNYFATSPESFKKDKLKFYKSFFEERTAPKDTILFISNVCINQKVAIVHSDAWLFEYINQLDMNQNNNFRFKFYLQLGHVAFVLCSTGEENKSIIYDPLYISPFSLSGMVYTADLNMMTPCPDVIDDTFLNRFLFNIIRVKN